MINSNVNGNAVNVSQRGQIVGNDPIVLSGSMVDKYEQVYQHMYALEQCHPDQTSDYQRRLYAVLYVFFQSTLVKKNLPALEHINEHQQIQTIKDILQEDWPFMGDVGQCSSAFAKLSGSITHPIIYATHKQMDKTIQALLPLYGLQVCFQNKSAPIQVSKLCARSGYSNALESLWNKAKGTEQQQLEQRITMLSSWIYTCIEHGKLALLEQAKPYVQKLCADPMAMQTFTVSHRRYKSVPLALVRGVPYEVYDSGVDLLFHSESFDPMVQINDPLRAQLLDCALSMIAPRYWVPSNDREVQKKIESLTLDTKTMCNGLMRQALYYDKPWALPVLEKYKVRKPNVHTLQMLKEHLEKGGKSTTSCQMLLSALTSKALETLIEEHQKKIVTEKKGVKQKKGLAKKLRL